MDTNQPESPTEPTPTPYDEVAAARIAAKVAAIFNLIKPMKTVAAVERTVMLVRQAGEGLTAYQMRAKFVVTSAEVVGPFLTLRGSERPYSLADVTGLYDEDGAVVWAPPPRDMVTVTVTPCYSPVPVE